MEVGLPFNSEDDNTWSVTTVGFHAEIISLTMNLSIDGFDPKSPGSIPGGVV